jgi:isopenicillin N synthase-like dioxygenase
MLERPAIPVVDVSALSTEGSTRYQEAVHAIDAACREIGFFSVTNGIHPQTLAGLERLSREFFRLSEEEKNEIAMSKAGAAWRGYFALGDELTSGQKDGKAGIYFGTAGTEPRPLHGANQYPRRPAALAAAVEQYMTEATELARLLMRAIACALGLDTNHFEKTITSNPTILFRIFSYPPCDAAEYPWGVGEHTDYGLLTILCVDDSGGLEVQTVKGEWLDVPPPPVGQNQLIVNLGDMLERLTNGRYVSTPHRVRNTGKDRISFPLFYDPSWDARVNAALVSESAPPRVRTRWDGSDFEGFSGTHGEYLTKKVRKCFPKLFEQAVGPGAS